MQKNRTVYPAILLTLSDYGQVVWQDFETVGSPTSKNFFWKNTKIATRLSVSYAGRESQNSVVYRSRSLSSSARRSYIMARCRASLTLDTARNACVVNIVSSLQLAVTFRHYITCTYWAQNIIVLPRRLLSLVYTRYRYFDRLAIMLL